MPNEHAIYKVDYTHLLEAYLSVETFHQGRMTACGAIVQLAFTEYQPEVQS